MLVFRLLNGSLQNGFGCWWREALHQCWTPIQGHVHPGRAEADCVICIRYTQYMSLTSCQLIKQEKNFCCFVKVQSYVL